MGETDKNSLVGQIGQILGVLSPIPDQLKSLFDKFELEVRERMEFDSRIQSDLRSVKESLDRLKDVFEGVHQKVNNADPEDLAETLDVLVGSVRDLQKAQEGLSRALKYSDGCSSVLSELEEKVRKLQLGVAELTDVRKSFKAVLKTIGVNLGSVVVALLIAYLAFKFGWVK